MSKVNIFQWNPFDLCLVVTRCEYEPRTGSVLRTMQIIYDIEVIKQLWRQKLNVPKKIPRNCKHGNIFSFFLSLLFFFFLLLSQKEGFTSFQVVCFCDQSFGFQKTYFVQFRSWFIFIDILCDFFKLFFQLFFFIFFFCKYFIGNMILKKSAFHGNSFWPIAK